MKCLLTILKGLILGSIMVRVNGTCTLYSGDQTTVEGPQVLCEECGFSGYINQEGECVCLTPAMDPNNECFAPGLSNETIVKTWEYYESPCECFTSFEEGFFRLTEPERQKIINGTFQYQWGDGPPPTCSRCYNPYYGPAPSLQTYSSRVNDTPVACGQYGGQDPVLLLETQAPTPFPVADGEGGGRRELLVKEGERLLDEQFSWSLCAGHGTWNYEFHGCECSTGWGLEEVPERGYNDSLIAICQKCQGPWGPLVPSQQYSMPQNLTAAENEQPYCGVVYTPDPLDGILKECGGHGSYFINECLCDFTTSLGFWVLEEYERVESTLLLVGPGEYLTVDVLYRVETCQKCNLPGDTPPCLQTSSPTGSPVSPTLAP